MLSTVKLLAGKKKKQLCKLKHDVGTKTDGQKLFVNKFKLGIRRRFLRRVKFLEQTWSCNNMGEKVMIRWRTIFS